MLIITGSIAYDYIMGFPGKFSDHILPEHIHNVNVSFIVDNFEKHRGGTAGNAAYTLGLLKTPHLLYSYAGKDFEDYQKGLAKRKISVKGVQIDKTVYTATAFALADNAQNQIWGFYPGASEKNVTLQLKKVLKPKALVLVGPTGVPATLEMIRQCIQLKVPYIFDPGFILTQVTDEDLLRGVRNATYIIGNEYEIQLMKKRIPSWTTVTKEKICITTLGEKGADIATNNQTIHIAPTKVKKVASTTGAGDAWRGGFLAGLERGFDVQTCGQMGAAAASFAVEYVGTQEHYYSIAQFKNRYRQTYKKLLHL